MLKGGPVKSEVRGSKTQTNSIFHQNYIRHGLLLQIDLSVTDGSIKLQAIIRPTLAFRVWHALKQEQYPAPQRLAAIWHHDIVQYVEQLRIITFDGAPDSDSDSVLENACVDIACASGLKLLPEPSHDHASLPEEVLQQALSKLMSSARQVSESPTLAPELAHCCLPM